MANRETGIGLMCRRDPAAAKAELKRVLLRRYGETTASARDLFIERRQMLRYIHRFSLWRYVWSVRRYSRRLLLPDEIKRALESR